MASIVIGDDTLNGGAGPDWLFAGWGADHLMGGDGDDRLHAAVDDSLADTLDCGAGQDRAVIRPGDSTSNCEVVKAIS